MRKLTSTFCKHTALYLSGANGTGRKYTYMILAVTVLNIVAPVQIAIAQGCLLAAGNTVAGLGTQVTLKGCAANKSYMLVMRPPVGTVYTQAVVTDDTGNAATLIPGKSATVAGQYQLQVDDVSASFTVAPDKVDESRSMLSASAKSMPVGGSVTVSALLRDRYENPISQQPVIALLSSRPQDTIEADAKQSDAAGRMSWTVQSSVPGLMTLTAYDVISAKALSTRLDIAVGSAAVAAAYATPPSYRAQLTGYEQGGVLPVDRFRLKLDNPKNEVSANQLFNVTIEALDANGDIVPDFTGPVILKSSDPLAEFPRKNADPASPGTGRVDFREVDLGVRKIPLGFLMRTGGLQTIEVFIQSNATVRGILEIDVLRGSSGTNNKIIIESPANDAVLRPRVDTEGNMFVDLAGKAPSLINLVVKGAREPVIGESRDDYTFTIPNVPLNPAYKEFTLFVASDDGAYESDPLRFRIDLDPPAIGNIGIDPDPGITGEPARITVEAEHGSAMVMKIGNETFPMQETVTGSYVVTYQTPNEEKTYDFTFEATDPAGNVSPAKQMQWTARGRKPGKVQNVKAESQPNGVLVSWEKPEGTLEIAEYSIYIADAEDPGNLLYTVSTKKPVTSALIKDLEIGRVYEFTVTAISREKQESEERSDPAQAGPQGLRLKATPGKNSVFLEWNQPANLPLAQFILKYGVESENFTETRTLNGARLSYEVADLLETTYAFSLTPVDVTGKPRTDLAATVRATPGSDDGYHPGASDPVPPNIFDDSRPLDPPPVEDEVTPSGLPTAMLASVIAMAFILGLFWRHYRKQRAMAREFLQMMEGRYHGKH